jgi:GDP-L-fucose synthase
LRKISRIFVAGAETMIGRALIRELRVQEYASVIDQQPDLTNAVEVDKFFSDTRPEYVFMAAGKSGGIVANQKYPADLMLDNLMVQSNVTAAAHRHAVTKMLCLASSCSYPRAAPQPLSVESLFSGPLEPTNEAYAVAKLSGITLCQAFRRQYGDRFIVGIPANAFGPEDDFDAENSHVVAALMLKMHEAKISAQPAVHVWGTGNARREFIFVDDLANACVFVMNEYEGEEPINLGGQKDVSISQLAGTIKEVVAYQGDLLFDTTKPDGMPLKGLDSAPLRALGWQPQTSLRDGLSATYEWLLKNKDERNPALELAYVR